MGDKCGYADTTTGEPCKWNEAEKGPCPWHSEEADEDAGKGGTLLEQDNSIKDLIAGALQNGSTIAEACAEAGLAVRTYYDWRDRGKQDQSDGEDTIFAQFLQETTRARRRAGEMDRERLREKCRETDDTRTWFKLHMRQYGDSYGDEDTDMRDGTQVILHESAESYEDAIKN